MATTHQHFVPAAGQRWLLPFYDPLIALLTRERRWRDAILDALDPKADDIIVDVGCGTGTLAVMAKAREPGAEIIGLDPDPDALARASAKALAQSMTIAFARGFGGDVAKVAGAGRANKIVSTLAMHHMSGEAQAQTLAAMREALAPGGAVHIADFTGGHFFHGADSGKLIADLTAAGFTQARKVGEFRTVFGRVTHVSARKAR